MYYGWEPIREIERPDSLVESSFCKARAFDDTDDILTDREIEFIKDRDPDFVFLYLVATDEKGGHDRSHGTDMPEDMLIPMFFCGEDFEGGKVPENVSILDIAPTIADAMGIIPPVEWEGKSIIKK